MKRQLQLNPALSTSMQALGVLRWINRRVHRGARRAAGELRGRLAQRANMRRMRQRRLFRFNAFRNPMRRGAASRTRCKRST